MEDEFPIKEIKIMDGVYMWKPEKKPTNDNNKDKDKQKDNNNANATAKDKNNEIKNKDNNKNLIGNKSSIGENVYLCKGKDELIKIYEIEFEELGNRVLALFQSNEDMMEFDPNDYDLIQAREENLELIDKKIAEMIKIQEKMNELCSYHPLVTVDIFEYFGIGKSPIENKENKEDKKDENNLVEVDNQDKHINKENKINNNTNNHENEIKEEKEENKIENIPKDKIENDNNNIITEIEL